MPAPAQNIASLDRARFDKLAAAKADADLRASIADEAVKQFCRQYSRAHGFGVNLTAEQVARDMEARG